MEEIEQHCRKCLSPDANNDPYTLSNEIRQKIRSIDIYVDILNSH